MLGAVFRGIVLAALAVVGLNVTAAAGAQLVSMPVPTATIYPGEVIDAGSLTDRTFLQSQIGSGYLDAPDLLIGKVAKRTLLPDHPIPANAVAEADLVKRGTQVQLVFQQQGLVITAYASPLQNGVEGDLIRVRNIDSGTVVVGVVQPDGSVRVGMK